MGHARKIVGLFFCFSGPEGFRSKENADILALSLENFQNRLNRTRTKLRSELQTASSFHHRIFELPPSRKATEDKMADKTRDKPVDKRITAL